MNRAWHWIVLVGLTGVIAVTGFSSAPSDMSSFSADPGTRLLLEAARDQRSGVVTETTGTVEAIIEADENGGARVFRVKLAPNQSVLVVDATPEVIAPVDAGDRVRVRGTYEWTEAGGQVVVRVSHGDVMGGWVMHAGRIYQ